MAEDKKIEIITVKGTGDDNRVVLWEKSPDHPNGEAFVSNDDTPREVAKTLRVMELVGSNRLEIVDSSTSGRKSATEEDTSGVKDDTKKSASSKTQ